MTILLYQLDSYIKNFQTTITRIEPETKAIILEHTAFYPGGGGQPCDFGFLSICGNTYKITRCKKIGDEVHHFLEANMDLPLLGDSVIGTIDWDRRYKLMRTHTAMHILCGTIFRDFGALVTGGDMDPLEGRMDFEFETMQKQFVLAIEKSVNTEILADRPIKVSILPREIAFQNPDLIRTKINLLPENIKSIRTVEIVGLDLQADGGTHVARTSEVGKINVVDYKSKGKINKRIYIQLSN